LQLIDLFNGLYNKKSGSNGTAGTGKPERQGKITIETIKVADKNNVSLLQQH
jgi:hypothetical protein